jgi:nucleoside-diphosphate-sugar epimerase
MTILVTGATGLVGTRLLPRLIKAGYDCRVLVRPGKTLPAGATAVEGDILDPGSLRPAVDGVTGIVHLAALFRNADEDATWKVNLDGTRHLIAAVRAQAPGARFIMASTGRVYDEDLPRPAREDDPVSGVSAYPQSKVAAEQALRGSGLSWSILRLAFVYGDGDGHLKAAPRVLAAWNWHPAAVMSLVHHRDIATAVELALTGAMDGHTVNIADEAPLSAYEIAQIVGADYGISAEPVNKPWNGHMDGSLARSLGFRATVPTAYQAAREGAL